MIAGDDLVGIDLLTGDELCSYKLSEHIKDALLALDRQVLYISDSVAGLLAFALPDGEEISSEELESLWEQKLPSSGRMDLMPLPRQFQKSIFLSKVQYTELALTNLPHIHIVEFDPLG